MKKLLAIILLFLNGALLACPVCERNQPKVLRGIVHGAGPESNWDYVSIGITIFLAVITLYFSIKLLVKPGEKNTDHIKYSILE